MKSEQPALVIVNHGEEGSLVGAVSNLVPCGMSVLVLAVRQRPLL